MFKSAFSSRVVVAAFAVVALAACSEERGDPLETVIPAPSVRIDKVRAYSTTVSFELQPRGALEVCYLILPSEYGTPSSEMILSRGIPASNGRMTYPFVRGLKPKTSYIVGAAARRWDEKSEPVYAEFETTDTLPAPAISLSQVSSTTTALTFRVNSVDNASYAMYLVLDAAAAPPSVDKIMNSDKTEKIDMLEFPVDITVEGLKRGTSYRIYALCGRGMLTSDMETLEMQTQP